MPAMSKLLPRGPPGLARPASRRPVKRALIIGINYTDSNEERRLVCAHNDARAWRELLVNTYEYRDEDITLMLDTPDTPSELKPTKKNILRRISLLVEGLQSGDRVVFFYAGHSQQLESKSVNEEDGFDEALQPVDYDGGNTGLIIDNDLRRLLVEPLPEGSWLTAVFDSCHSGTLLDLDHYQCNSVYFPWLSRGYRRSRSIWQDVGRKNAKDSYKRNIRVTSLSSEAAARTNLNLPLSGAARGRADLRMYGRERASKGRVLKFDASIDELASDEKGEKHFVLTRSSSMQVKRNGTFPGLKATIKRCYSFDHNYRKLKNVGFWFMKARSESPEPIGRTKCDGFCKATPNPQVHVVSISACQDPQQTYESRRGQSMTKELVELLKRDPYPPCRQLVLQLGHSLHKTAMQVHQASRKQILRKKSGMRVTRVLDGVNFPEPQVGSQHTLTDDYRLKM